MDNVVELDMEVGVFTGRFVNPVYTRGTNKDLLGLRTHVPLDTDSARSRLG